MPAGEPHIENTRPEGEQHSVEAEAPFAEEVASLQAAVESGQDPIVRAKFLLHLIEASLDPGLSEDDKKKALQSAAVKVYDQMSEPAREVFADVTAGKLAIGDTGAIIKPSESSDSDPPETTTEEVDPPESDDSEPTPKDPEITSPPIIEVTATANGSEIRIIDPDEILGLARRDGKVEIYNKSDFKTDADKSIERINTRAWAAAEGNIISLCSTIELNPAGNWNFEALKSRFKNYFPRWDESKYLKRDGLLITPTKFNNNYIAKDENGAVFGVLVYTEDETPRILVRNYNMSTDKETGVPTPTLDQVDASEQLKSLGRVTALVADLCATLGTGRQGDDDEATINSKKKHVLNHRLQREYIFAAHNIEHLAAALDNAETGGATGKKDVSFEDIGGYDEVKKKLENTALMFSRPGVARKWDSKPPNGILLYGPPGTGKTTLAEAFANEIGADFVQAGSAEIYEKWVGSSGKNLMAIFDEARTAKGRVVLFFDEIESFVNKSKYDDTRNDIAGVFKTEMTKLAVNNPNVIVVAATNDLDKLDPGMIRPGRFDRRIDVPLPNDRDRVDIIALLIEKSFKASGGFRIFAEDIVPADLANVTDGLSGADIAEVFNRLKAERTIRDINNEPVTPISQQELFEGVDRYREEKESQRRLDN
ncbi:MAG: ATP-binding protein [Patescibacteria group bacterium]